MSGSRTPSFVTLLVLACAACGSFEFLTTEAPRSAPVPETFTDCVRRLRAAFDPATAEDESDLAPLLRSQCGMAACDGPCAACIEDPDCGPARLCLKGVCAACPDVSECEPPEAGLELLQRNGCRVCKFAPPSQCLSDSDCPQGTCRRGAVCADDCRRLDCCANACAPPTCPEPVPLGCLAVCDDPGVFLPECRTSECRCTAGLWSCDAVSSPFVLGSCVYRAP